MDNVTILDKIKCTGCGLCNNICPTNAITMLPDNEGFIRPVINEEKCVQCGLCARKCPALSNERRLNGEFTSYAVWAKDGYRKQGSSGGVFPIIADWAIEQKGVVYGAAFEEGCRSLVHKGICSKKELPSLFKSKYVQSDASLTYREVKENLEQGKTVVYSGCPCQIDALKIFLGRDYDNLYTIDILCHGAPSPLAYNKFLDEVSQGKKITHVDFRDKTYGWGTLIKVDFEDGSFHRDMYNGNYFRAFLSGLSMREGCYTCHYAQSKRVGDLTLGDFWGVANYKEDWNDKKGTSVVLVNNAKGQTLLDKILKQFARVEQVPAEQTIDICRKANGALLFPTRPHSMRKCFFRHLTDGDSFSKSLRYAEKGLLDVGILGWWIETPRSNYGSNLTDFALYKYVESLGLSAAFISPPNFNREHAGEFNKKYNYRMTAKYDMEHMSENNRYFKSYIVASDTLWYYDAMINYGWTFMLDFASEGIRKISYSTSFGNTIKFFPESEMPKARYLLNRFDWVSVREYEGVDVCRERFGVEATQVLDPVFLNDMKDWEMLSNNAERKTEGDYLFAYMLDPNPQKASELIKLAKKLKLKLVTITDRQNKTEEREEILKHCGVLSKASMEEFVHHLLNAKFVVADSFHGFCFALLFKKPFATLVNKARGRSRFDTLSSIVDCGDRMFESLEDVNGLSAFELLTIDHDKIQTRLDMAKDRSKKWLNDALFSECKPKVLSPEIINGKELYDAKKKITELEEIVFNLNNTVEQLKKQ